MNKGQSVFPRGGAGWGEASIPGTMVPRGPRGPKNKHFILCCHVHFGEFSEWCELLEESSNPSKVHLFNPLSMLGGSCWWLWRKKGVAGQCCHWSSSCWRCNCWPRLWTRYLSAFASTLYLILYDSGGSKPPPEKSMDFKNYSLEKYSLENQNLKAVGQWS